MALSKPKTIAQEWGSFSKMVFGDKKPSDVQYSAMRQAFYGGAMIMFKNITSLPDSGTEEEACVAMDNYSREISVYVAESISLIPPEQLIDAIKQAVAAFKGKQA